MTNANLIDPEAIENLRALNPDDAEGFLRDIIGIFLEDTPQRLDELKISLEQGDQVRFTRAAHSIKGSSSNLGAMPLRAVAEKLEHESRANGLGNVQDYLAQLSETFSATKMELEKIISVA
ncbi:MAG TPA: Hpt domain-containing protein [Opitutaceae bacterium]|nr:Hpt domain-containing protein [Opitutaceae bacterium]